MSESAEEQNDGSAALRAVTTVIYAHDAGRNRKKKKKRRRLNRFVYFPPRESARDAQLSNAATAGKGNIEWEYRQKLVDTSSHLLPACNTPFNRGWSIITRAKILGTDFQPDSFGVLAEPLTGLVDMSRF